MKISLGCDWMSIVPHWSQCILYSVGNVIWADEDLQIHALHFVSKLVIIYNIQLCDFPCITSYSICILVNVAMYFNYFTALPYGLQGVPVAKKYQMCRLWQLFVRLGQGKEATSKVL